jgi:hypothetical protein
MHLQVMKPICFQHKNRITTKSGLCGFSRKCGTSYHPTKINFAMMKRILLFISIVFLGFSSLQAQTTCTDQLKLTQRRFDDGLLEDIPQMLSDCMKNGFTKEEKTNAYKLLIQTYLFSEESQKADEVMIQFLSEFPSYVIAANDPKEFINLYNTYRTTPIFKLEIGAGGSFCMPVMIEPFGTGDILTKKPTYNSKLGYTFELNYIDKLFKDFDFSIGASLSLSNFGYTNQPYDYSTVTGTFNNIYIGLPLMVRYNYKFKGINLFAKAGLEPVYLAKSSVDLTRTDNIPGREPITGTEDLISSHRRFDMKPLLAIGAKVKIGSDQILFSAGFKFNAIDQINPQKYYSNHTLFEKYYFVEDNLLLNQAYISVSYIRPIYKPKKIK